MTERKSEQSERSQWANTQICYTKQMRKAKEVWQNRRVRISVIVLALLLILVLPLPILYTFTSTRNQRYDLEHVKIQDVPQRRVAIVFGAGIYENKAPTPYLRWRIETAVKLYKAGRVQKILMSGDNSTVEHNEPFVMSNYAKKLGVPDKDLAKDYAGFNTYDTCYRAWAVFEVKEAILVTQGYHLPRAVVTCQRQGLNVIGVAAQSPQRDWAATYLVREVLSTDKMVVQNIINPGPKYLGPKVPVK